MQTGKLLWASFYSSQQGIWYFSGEDFCRGCISPPVHVFKKGCQNPSNSSFIDVEKQKPFGSDPRKRQKRMKLRPKATQNAWVKRYKMVFLHRGVGAGREGRRKVKVHSPQPLYHQIVLGSLSAFTADQASHLSVWNPMTSTYMTGHLIPISDVPARRWGPSTAKAKVSFQAIRIF